MSDEYTYTFPDPEKFIHTLRKFLLTRNEQNVSKLLQGAECSFGGSDQFSRVRWNTYDATLRLYVPIEKFELFSEPVKNKILIHADKIFPQEAGYELKFIEVSPILLTPENGETSITSMTANSQLMRFKPIWGEPKIDDVYACNVFMIMPFRPELDEVYTKVVKPTVESLGLNIRRGDDPFTDKDIMFDVWSMLNACQLVIADCTGRNPNVFYELGIAHTLGKPVIMLTQNLEDFPFDVKSKRVIEYDIAFHQIDKLKDKLKKSIQSMLPNKKPQGISPDDEIPF